ncbi:SHOCT domain-containing protein [Streptomyces sp. NPDC002205]|uniref:SHOCT domain-containing protein n=1 Tax=Streptomyces sp. NPDC002205 TaxID=3154411 RepID=UPI00331AEE3F
MLAERVIAMMWGYGWGLGYWLSMGITMLLFWGLIVVGIIALVRYVGGTRKADTPGPVGGQARAEDVLAERYARGEIDDDEYKRRLALLRTHQ